LAAEPPTPNNSHCPLVADKPWWGLHHLAGLDSLAICRAAQLLCSGGQRPISSDRRQGGRTDCIRAVASEQWNGENVTRWMKPPLNEQINFLLRNVSSSLLVNASERLTAATRRHRMVSVLSLIWARSGRHQRRLQVLESQQTRLRSRAKQAHSEHRAFTLRFFACFFAACGPVFLVPGVN